MRIYEVRDPVYGFIQFNEWEREVINHPVFQRLRRIRQLALTEMVYPGAIHTRFEHSLGVMHLAGKMYDAIVSQERNRRIMREYLDYDEAGFNRDRQIIRFAALLHDIGHGAFSHPSEELFPKISESSKKRYKHEDYTAYIIRNVFKDVIESHKLNENYKIEADEVAKLIEGRGGRVSFWKVLISSQLDADRSDYLLRDSLHIGVKYGVYDLDRLLVTLSLGLNPESDSSRNEKEKGREVVLGISKGGWHVAEALIIARYQMFTQVYYHKTRRAYDYMLNEAMKSALGKPYPPPHTIEEFLQFDDLYMWELMKKNGGEWFDRIVNRDHIRMVAETKETPLKEEIEYIEKVKETLRGDKIWFWEDTPEEAKSWYKISEEEEILIIDENGSALPLSRYSNVVKSLKDQFAKSRIYVKSEDKDEVLKKIEEV